MIRVLVLGVNPFEDLPGYQLFSLLKSSCRYEVIAGDDSAPALSILSMTGAQIEALPTPSVDPHAFTTCVARLCERHGVQVILPGADAPLYALASCLHAEPQLAPLCPTLNWLDLNDLRNKWDLQEWASGFAITPPRWKFDDEEDAAKFAAKSMYPLMVKGLRKGAIKCDDELEAIVARRALLRNPANQGLGGGAYAEYFVEGEEHSLFLLGGNGGRTLAMFGLRKLAVTQAGTTLAAQIDHETPSEFHIPTLLSRMPNQTPLEIEWRKDSADDQWLFELNVRFPSWIGALGSYGLNLLEAHLDSVLSHGQGECVHNDLPRAGSVFYRLPQSGFLPIEAAFEGTRANACRLVSLPISASPTPLLWKAASPHQFRLK